ncbi:hypothetical protein AB0D13_09160 [Streptomyces sp. NPDC048430]
MTDVLNEIQRYGWPILALIALGFVLGLALDDLVRSWLGKGNRGK